MPRALAGLLLAVLAVVGAAACRGSGGGSSVSPRVVASRTLTLDGGRVDWCQGSTLIAFDRTVTATETEVYTIRPDGSDERCLTCDDPDGMPTGIRGQPAWHPSCEFLVIQVQGAHYSGNRFQFVSWGIDNDLWLLAADGSWAEKLVTVGQCEASLHPQFSDAGDRLFWAVRTPTGDPIPQNPADPTPCAENPWDGWHLAVAPFGRPAGGPAVIGSRTNLYATVGGFFESHALVGNRIWFSHTAAGAPYVDDSATADATDGGNAVNLTSSPGTWDEHAQPSPGGRAYAFNSSRGFAWAYPPDTAGTLRLELWASVDGRPPVRLTDFNGAAPAGTRVLTSDFAWGPTGRELLVYHADAIGSVVVRQVIEVLTLDAAY